ncbi:hypothetical protein HAX54_051307 [Datura stramonium]|uniref:Uncharacterized protein n=1 Tax=Datura stramonium TaxID=4076 RepID=A0ABS8SY17_DATST|nr:hypothetical protein [Datura stramonium]
MRGTVNSSMLSLSLNKGKDISQEGSCKNGLNIDAADDTACTNRSNWDLNTPMDSWEGSGDDVPVVDASQIDMLGKTSGSLDIKPPISSASVIGSNGDKGKQVVGASEQEFNFPISIYPSLPYKPLDGLRLSLGSTLRDLSVVVGLSTPSRYSVHTNEANRTKNALDLANADIAAKNANFDVKESNVSSDKVEVSVSEGMNIEDHMVYKKTQDPHNMVASGEGSANDEEKISISAGTEEECYGSDYESDGHHAFAGHVDTESVGCGREDEEYEDGEVRE